MAQALQDAFSSALREREEKDPLSFWVISASWIFQAEQDATENVCRHSYIRIKGIWEIPFREFGEFRKIEAKN